MSPTGDKPITLDWPDDAPTWARPLFVAQYELRLEFRRHLRRCDERHPRTPVVDLWDRAYKVVRMLAIVGGVVAGAMLMLADRAARDVARAAPQEQAIRIIQSPPAAPVIVYTTPDAGRNRRALPRQR